mgnify:CR=1 FL=1
MDRRCLVSGGQFGSAFSSFALLATLLTGLTLGCTSKTSPAGLAPARPPSDLAIEEVLRAKVDVQIAFIDAHPADAQAHGLLGMIYQANEVWEPAMRAYLNAATLAPDQPEWLFHAAKCEVHTGNSTNAKSKFADLATRFTEFAPGRHRYGLALIDDGDFDGAERELAAALRLKPTLSEVHAAFAQLRNVQSRFAEALLFAEKAVELDPRSLRARFLRGQALRGLGRLADAKPDLDAGSGAAPGQLSTRLDAQIPGLAVGMSVQVDKGADLVEAGRVDEAIQLFRAALVERPDHAALLTNLAVAYQRKGDYAASSEILETLLAKSPDDLPVLLNLAQSLMSAGDHKRGLEVSSHAAERHPQSGLARYAKGRVLYSLSRVSEGLAECVRAGELEPQNGEIQSAIGAGYFMTNQLDLAEDHFRRSIELDPRSLSPRINLCGVLFRLGKRTEAEAALTELEQLAPENPRVKSLVELLATTPVEPPERDEP